MYGSYRVNDLSFALSALTTDTMKNMEQQEIDEYPPTNDSAVLIVFPEYSPPAFQQLPEPRQSSPSPCAQVAPAYSLHLSYDEASPSPQQPNQQQQQHQSQVVCIVLC